LYSREKAQIVAENLELEMNVSDVARERRAA
jgi:transposase-like protein